MGNNDIPGAPSAKNEVRATTRQKIGYALGDFSYNFIWYIISAMLLIFYTDVALIPAVVCSLIILMIRLSDAVIDPVIGTVADGTRIRRGRYRPWILMASFFMLVFITLTFWAHPDWNLNATVVRMIVPFALTCILPICTNMPYGALNAVVPQNSDDRTFYAAFRMALCTLGSTLIGSLIAPMLTLFGNGDNVKGYLITVPIVCTISGIFFIVCFFSIKEVVPNPAKQKKEKTNFKGQFKQLSKNPPLMLLLLSFFIFGITAYGRIAIIIYFFTYVVGDVGLFSTFNLVCNGIAVVGNFLAPVLIAKSKSGNKGRVALLAMIIMAVCYIAMYFVASDMMRFFFFGAIGGIGMGILSSTIFGMVPDTIEYGQWKTGKSSSAFNYAFTSLMFKWGGAAGPALLGFVLAIFGYVPNVEQSGTVLTTITFMATIAPAILCLINIIPLWFYKLDRALYGKILGELRQREASQSE